MDASSPATYTPGGEVDAILVDAPFAILPNLATLSQHLTEGGEGALHDGAMHQWQHRQGDLQIPPEVVVPPANVVPIPLLRRVSGQEVLFAGAVHVGDECPDVQRPQTLPDGLLQRLGDVPLRIVGAHLAQVGVVTDVVAGAVLVDVGADLFFAGKFFGERERLEDRTRVGLAAAEIIDLARARRRDESGHE